MIDIVDRLSFDATRCEVSFSKGVASNIEEGIAEIKKLRSDLQMATEYADILLPLFEDHYWDSLEHNKDIVLAHVKAVLGMDVGTEQSVAYWRRIANERLRALWIIAHGAGGRFAVGKSAAENYPGDDVALVTTHTDPAFGDFIIEARRL